MAEPACLSNLEQPVVTALTWGTLARMQDDPVNKPRLMAYLYDGIVQGEARLELRTVLRALALALQPKAYLEIGVRRGWSMAQVLAASPLCHAYGCDKWTPNYGDAPNPGPEWVRAELQRAAPKHFGGVDFLTGRSLDVLPGWLPGRFFELICVDGDHTGGGALADLRMCLPHVAPGGCLVFDDLVDAADIPGLTLREAWQTAQAETAGFAWYEYAGLVPVGVAVRL